MIKVSDIYSKTHNGLDIILDYYPQAEGCVDNKKKFKRRRFLPHCQPFRDLNNPHQIIPQWQKDMAHWADRKEIYMSCDFKDFSPRKGFLCKEYFKML